MSASPIYRLPGADVSAGARFEALARIVKAQALDETLPAPDRLQLFRDSERYETRAALADADDLLAQFASEIA